SYGRSKRCDIRHPGIQDRLADQTEKCNQGIAIQEPSHAAFRKHVFHVNDGCGVKEKLKADLGKMLSVLKVDRGQAGEHGQRPAKNQEKDDGRNEAKERRQVAETMYVPR